MREPKKTPKAFYLDKEKGIMSLHNMKSIDLLQCPDGFSITTIKYKKKKKICWSCENLSNPATTFIKLQTLNKPYKFSLMSRINGQWSDKAFSPMRKNEFK